MWSIRDLKMKGYKKSRSKKGDKYIVYKCDLQERMSTLYQNIGFEVEKNKMCLKVLLYCNEEV